MKPKLTKKELGALITVRDMLDNGLIESRRRTTGGYVRDYVDMALRRIFDMAIPAKTTDCGTVACIGGWMGTMMGLKPNAASEFVMKYEDSGKFNKLFYPDRWMNNYSKITPKQAVKAIDNFLETGNPRWEKIR